MIAEQKLFLNPELTISEFASISGVHANVLSQVINSVESKLCYYFIKVKQIEEFKGVVALPENQK